MCQGASVWGGLEITGEHTLCIKLLCTNLLLPPGAPERAAGRPRSPSEPSLLPIARVQVRKWHYVIPGYPWPDSESDPKYPTGQEVQTYIKKYARVSCPPRCCQGRVGNPLLGARTAACLPSLPAHLPAPADAFCNLHSWASSGVWAQLLGSRRKRCYLHHPYSPPTGCWAAAPRALRGVCS